MENKFLKVPPQALEPEEAVLGALMLERSAYDQVESILTPEAFYTDGHQVIYKAIQSLHKKNKPVDIITVTAELTSTNELGVAGGAYEVTQLTSRLASAANIEYHAHIILEQYMRRQAISIASDIIQKGYDQSEDVFELLEKAAVSISNISDVSSDEMSSISSVVLSNIDDIEKTRETDGVTGVPTGFENLDRITSGWQKGDMITLAGRPGMGKSSILTELVLQASARGKHVAFFTLEVTKQQLVMKMQANISEINFDTIKRNRLTPTEWEAFQHGNSKLSERPIHINDTSALKVRTLKSRCRKLKSQGKLDMIAVDYLQLMDGREGSEKGGTREQEVSYISRSLKNLAKELEVPLIALAALSREVERRGGKKEPMLSDLKDSGSIEADSDIVIFIHRPEYYQITETEDGESTAGLAQIIFAKYRNGETTRTNLRFIPNLSKFVRWESTPTEPKEIVSNGSLNRSFYEPEDHY